MQEAFKIIYFNLFCLHTSNIKGLANKETLIMFEEVCSSPRMFPLESNAVRLLGGTRLLFIFAAIDKGDLPPPEDENVL